jgi:hypothetical protein
LKSIDYLSKNEPITEIIKELNNNNKNKNDKLSDDLNLKDKLLLINNENDINETNADLLSAEILPTKTNNSSSEFNIEMEQINNEKVKVEKSKTNSNTLHTVKSRKFKRQQTKVTNVVCEEEEEVMFTDEEKGPVLFRLSISDLSYVEVWTTIKKIIMSLLIIIALLFYVIIPFIVKEYAAEKN